MEEKACAGDFIAGFLVGTLVGAAAALLMAPQTGEETRALIRDKGIELQDRAGELSADARQRAQDLQVQAKERASDLSTRTRGKAGELQSKVKQAIEEGKAAADENKADLLVQAEDPAEEEE